MNINIKATNMDLTGAIEEYVYKRVESLGKIIGLDNPSALIRVEVGKISEHHKSGEVYFAEFDIRVDGVNYFATSKAEDLYAAIDDTRDDMMRQGRKKKGRMRDLFERGARSIKKRLKGLK